jgi:hypothetical protein
MGGKGSKSMLASHLHSDVRSCRRLAHSFVTCVLVVSLVFSLLSLSSLSLLSLLLIHLILVLA